MKDQSANLRAAESARQIQPTFLAVFNHGSTRLFICNYDKPVVVENGSAPWSDPQTFTPATMEYTATEESGAQSGQPGVLSVGANDPELRKYFLKCPTAGITVQVYRVNSSLLPGPVDFTDIYREASGQVQSVAFAGYQAEVSFLNEVQQEDRPILNYFFQKTCNVKLGSVPCTINRELYKLNTLVWVADRFHKTIEIVDNEVVVDSPTRTLTITRETFQGGKIVKANGEETGIIACEPDTGAGTRLWLNHWPGFTVGETVTIYLGCLKIVRVCDETFENKENFRGMPYIPASNPATNSIVT